MYENRRHLRFREIIDVRWAILGTDISGEGQLLNISSSGLKLVTDARFDPNQRGLLYIDAHGQVPLKFGAKKGKVIWVERLPDNKPGYLCGIEFASDKGWDKILSDWINNKTEELGQTGDAKILNNYVMLD